MSACTLHPNAAAAGTCEYCAQPHCGPCLQEYLGRRYCPPCLERVRTVATGRRPAPGAGPAAASGRAGQQPSSVRTPRLSGWLSALLYLVGFLVVLVIAQTVGMLPLLLAKQIAGQMMGAGAGRATSDPLNAQDIGIGLWTLLFSMFAWGSLAVVLAYTAGVARALERRSLAELGLAWRGTGWRDLLLGVALAAVLFISVVGVGVGSNWFSIRLAAGTLEALVIPPVGFLLLLPLAAVEEIAMRGYLLNAVARSWGRGAGVAVSTLAFAGLHAINPHFLQTPLAVVGLLLAGLYLATAYLVTENLWLAIFLHTGWNLMEGPVFGLPVSGTTAPASVFRTAPLPGAPTLWTGGEFGPEASLLLCILMVAHLGVLWAMRPLLKPAEPPYPGGVSSSPGTYQALPVS